MFYSAVENCSELFNEYFFVQNPRGLLSKYTVFLQITVAIVAELRSISISHLKLISYRKKTNLLL